MIEGKREKFYFKGKFFDTFHEFIEHVQKWHDNPTEVEDIDRLMEDLKENVVLNMMLQKKEIKNHQMMHICNSMFEEFLRQLFRLKD